MCVSEPETLQGGRGERVSAIPCNCSGRCNNSLCYVITGLSYRRPKLGCSISVGLHNSIVSVTLNRKQTTNKSIMQAVEITGRETAESELVYSEIHQASTLKLPYIPAITGRRFKPVYTQPAVKMLNGDHTSMNLLISNSVVECVISEARVTVCLSVFYFKIIYNKRILDCTAVRFAPTRKLFLRLELKR